jgi:multiple sugar transport system substrate-binding protein
MIIVQDFFMMTPVTSEKKEPQGEITLGDIGKPKEIEQETIVVPAQTEEPAPILPQFPSAPAPVAPVNPWPKRIIALFIILILIIGAVFGGRWLFGMFEGSKEVTITYWGLWENDAVLRPVIASFESTHPKIRVQYIKQSHKQYRERLQAAIDRGEGPDVFRFHNTWVPMLAKELTPVPQTVMTVAEFQNTFFPVAANDLIGGAIIYGIPLEIDGLGLYYNEDLFARAGITTPPTTWAEVLEMIPKIAKPEGETFTVSAIALGTTNNVEHYSDILATMFMQNGANLSSPEGKEAEETLLFYRKFASSNDPLYTWNETMDNSIYAFASGKVAMILAPSWRAFDIVDMNPSLRFKIAPIPQLPGNTVNWASYWVEGVSSKSKYPAQAMEFMKYLTSKEGATILYSEEVKARKLFGEPYARTELASSLINDPYVGAYVAQGANARSFPLASRTFDNGLNDKLIVYVENALNALKTGSSPGAELETMKAGFQQVFTTYGLTTNTTSAQQQPQ